MPEVKHFSLWPALFSYSGVAMRNKQKLVGLICLMLFASLLVLIVSSNDGVRVSELPDGTRYRLALVTFTNNYNYRLSSIPRWIEPFLPVIPDAVEKKFLNAGWSMVGLGGTVESNLMVVIDISNSRGNATKPKRLRIRDDNGNSYDGNMVRGLLSNGEKMSAVYLASVTPNRSKKLYFEPLVVQADGTWTNMGPFTIVNPKHQDYPQWSPEATTQKRVADNLTATLIRFESGPGSPSVTESAPISEVSPRSTLLEFDYAESEKPTDDFRLHKVTISDATGNKWSPFLDPITPSSSRWAKNGATEFLGGLWPGEDAWKLEVQAIRTAAFDSNNIWQVPSISMPGADSYTDLINEFTLGDSSIQIANILAPDVQVTNRWRGIVRYWGKETSVYSVGMECKEMGDRRPVILEARNENGTDFKIVNHRNVDHPMQSIFIQPPAEGAKELNLKLAFPELKTFEFLARPAFRETAATVP